MPILYIVATPIGNLEDISFRALNIFKKADLILCEDTRVTKKLLNHYNIKTPTESYHQHSKFKKVSKIEKLLSQNKTLALVSDSGTPGISDPGNKLINYLVDKLANLKIIPVPGPNAAIAAASISGFAIDCFSFMGFPPHKKGRKKFFNQIADSNCPIIIYESPYRILKTLKQLGEISNFEIVICRELTKKFETIYRGKINNVIQQIKPKGEFVVVIKP